MVNEFWSKFKSGSDIRGTASEGIISQPIDLTDDVVEKITKAFAYFLKLKTNKQKLTVALGHDSRISAKKLSDCVIKALVNSGVNVIFTGLSSTPSMFMITKDNNLDCDGSIQLTASHHPFNKNGLKFFTKESGLEGFEITEILQYAQENKSLHGFGSVKNINFLDTYCQILIDFFRSKTGETEPLKGKKIIVDAGNGAGGFFADKVLKPLGADTEGSQFLEPDGYFPNHIPNPENETAMLSICRQVKKVKADFGIIFDTDVDRAGAVDSNGEEINRNRLIALISAILLEETPNCTIVTDSVTSNGLKEFIKSRGGVHHRFKRGYKNVINEALRLNSEGVNCPLAIETSGHAALKENYFLDDGAYLITRILIKMAQLAKENKTLTALISDLKNPEEATEIRMGFVEGVNFKEYGSKVVSDLSNKVKTDNNAELEESTFEGVRINFLDNNYKGWLLLRLSVHDPIMPLNIESDAKGGNKLMAKWLYDFLKAYDKLNLDNLINFIK